MRTVSGPETTVITGRVSAQFLKVEIKNAAGSWVDYSSYLSIDWQDRCTINVDVNQRIAEATLEIARETEVGSLSPLINTEIKAGRAIRIGGSRVAVGAAASFKPLFLGIIDRIDWKSDPMSLVARDDAGLLVDRWIRTETDYGTESGQAIESVMQGIINDWGASMVLYTPVSPGFMITPYRQQKSSVMEALQTLADLIGWVIEYRWDNGTGAFRLTFYEPDRVPVGTDWTFGPDDYYEVTRLDEDTADVRNIITIRYTNAATGVREPYEVEDPASIAAYDEQWAELEEADDSPIDSAAEAQVMGDAALADLAWPVADQEIEVDLFWPVQLGDYYEFLPNGKHYTVAQEFGVTGYTHVFEDGKARTRIRTRGKPVGHTQGWLKRETKPRPPGDASAAGMLQDFREISRTSTEVTYSWRLGSDLTESWIHDYQEDQPYSNDKWPGIGRSPDSVTADREPTYVVAIPEQGKVGYFQVEGRTADGSIGDMERVLFFPANVAGDYIAFAAVTVNQSDGSVEISGWTTDRALSVAYAYNVGVAGSVAPPSQSDAETQGGSADGGGLVTGFSSDFTITLPAGTVDFGEVIKGLLIAYLNADGTGPDGTAQDHDTPVGFQGERFKITVAGQLEDGVVISQKLREGAQSLITDIVFSATDWDTVAWTAGTVRLAGGSVYSIASGNTGNLANADPRYIYLNPAVSTTVLQVSTASADALGDGRILLAVAWRAPASNQEAAYVPVVGLFGINETVIGPNSISTGHIQALAIQAGQIDAGAVTAAKINVASLDAISANMGTITAGTIDANVIVAADSFTAPQMNIYGGAINPIVTIDDTAGLRITDGGLNFHQIFYDGSNNMLIQAAFGVSVRVNDTLIIEGDIDHNGGNVGFYGSSPISQPTVTGSRGGNAALASLLTALENMGLIVDSSS